MIARHFSPEISSGFSTSTWMPALRAGIANSAWRQFGVAR